MNLRSHDKKTTSFEINLGNNSKVVHSPNKANLPNPNQVSSSTNLKQEIVISNNNSPNTSIESTEETENNSENSIGLGQFNTNVSNLDPTDNLDLQEQEENNMANQVIFLKDALRVVPEYDGERLSLTDFFAGLDEAKVMIGEANQANLVRIVRSRLIGEARRSIRKKEFLTIEELKTHLKNYFFSTKTVFQLQGELGSLYQKENESVSKFANRVVDCGETLIEVYKLESQPTADDTTAFTNNTQSNVRKCFKRGLRPEIEQRLADNADIDELVKQAITIERELFAKNALRNQPNSLNSFKPNKVRVSAIQQREEKTVSYESEDEETANLAYQANTSEQKKVTFKDQSKCGWCYGPHGTRECPLLADKKEELARSTNIEVTCNWCLKKGHSMRTCWTAQREFFDLYKPPQQTHSKSSESNRFCHYCKDPNHLIENCPKRPKPENSVGSWRNQKNESTPSVRSDQKGSQGENRSLNWVKVDSLEISK